jgi:ubiquinone/menaquinone biosynthesis C-methylase UbiE
MSLVSNFTQPDTQARYFIEFLEQLDQEPGIRQWREVAAERIAAVPGSRILDLGCGIGGATFVFAERSGVTGKVAGVDISPALVQEASRRAGDRRGVEFRVGEATAIPYPSGFFDAAYSERVFLYLPDRRAALEELRRVVQPGGRICLVDTDFDSTTIYSSRRELTRKLTTAVAATLANPTSARELPALARRAGLKDLRVETFAGATPYRFMVHAMGGALRQAAERGVVSAAELDEWLDEQARLNESGDFFHVWLFVRVTGTV